MELAGSSALVTGGGGGLGSATARHLASLGMTVVIFDRNVAEAEAVAKTLSGAAVAVGGDVTDDDDVATAVEAARTRGPLRLVVNVAGGGVPSRRLVGRDGTPHDRSAFEFTMAINAVGTFNVSRLAAAAMAQNEPDEDGQRGVIVNTSSLAGLEGQAGQLAYAAAKAAVAGMTLPMARDLAPLGIRVCAIAPGTMATPVFAKAPEALKERRSPMSSFPNGWAAPRSSPSWWR